MMKIVEGVAGTYHYHLRDDKDLYHLSQPALCGARVMSTEIPLEYWGQTPRHYHLPERWCAECQRLAALGKR